MSDRAYLFICTVIVSFIGAGISSPVSAQWTENECTAIHTITGETSGDQHGWIANPIGDVTGDGINDFISTAPTNDGNGSNSGRIYIYDGASGVELWRFTGLISGSRLGADGDGVGDVTGDGVPDVIAGAPAIGTGRAYLFSGDDGTLIHTFEGEVSGDQFGFATTGGSDFNGDGTFDILITATLHDANGSNSGRSYVYSGADFSLICTIDGNTGGDFFGTAASFVGDINADGRDDVIVCARLAGANGEGYVYSWDGKQCNLVHTLIPPNGSSFGWFFSNGGHDVNADGTPDIYVSDFSANRAWIFSGLDGSIIWGLNGEGQGGQFGIGRIVEDVNNDGHADMILAAWQSGQGAGSAGKAFLYSGKDASVIRTMTYTVAGAGFGFDAAGMGGDVNGDGAYDFLITAASEAGSTGKTFVMAGVPVSTTVIKSVEITRGTLLSGGVAELVNSDDSYLNTRSGFGNTLVDLHSMEMIVSAVSTVDAATTLDLTIELRIDQPSGLAQIRLRNWNTTQFDSVGSYSIGNADQIDMIDNIDTTNYVDGAGNIDLSIKHLVFVPFLAFTFESFIDQVEIIVE